jgi:predicted metal-dependent phosphoesterase TrpH
MADQAGKPAGIIGRSFLELHCHTSASFDSLANPMAVARAAAARIDAALRVRDAAPDGLEVIVGEEVKTTDGDLIAVFLSEVVRPGLSAVETIAAVREQGGLVGVPHPFDGRRGFGRKSGTKLEEIATLVDWIEVYNARVVGGSANDRAAEFARDHALAGVAASDSHTVMEVGVAYNAVSIDPGTPEGLLVALRGVELHPGRATFYVRAWTPLAKAIQSLRGNGRVRPDSNIRAHA